VHSSGSLSANRARHPQGRHRSSSSLVPSAVCGPSSPNMDDCTIRVISMVGTESHFLIDSIRAAARAPDGRCPIIISGPAVAAPLAVSKVTNATYVPAGRCAVGARVCPLRGASSTSAQGFTSRRALAPESKLWSCTRSKRNQAATQARRSAPSPESSTSSPPRTHEAAEIELACLRLHSELQGEPVPVRAVRMLRPGRRASAALHTNRRCLS